MYNSPSDLDPLLNGLHPSPLLNQGSSSAECPPDKSTWQINSVRDTPMRIGALRPSQGAGERSLGSLDPADGGHQEPAGGDEEASGFESR